jgi:integrase
VLADRAAGGSSGREADLQAPHRLRAGRGARSRVHRPPCQPEPHGGRDPAHLQREVLPHWGSWTVGEVRKRDVIALLDRIRERGSPIMANRVLAAVRKFFNWCIGRAFSRCRPALASGAPAREQARHRVLSDEELRRCSKAAREIGFPFGSIVEMLALTGQRREEVGAWPGSSWTLSPRVWVIPGEHAKNGKPHLVHLSPLPCGC